LSPVDSLIAFKQDSFYRNRPWRRSNDPDTLEITVRDMSHVILTKGTATFDIPPWKEYRLEVYHGLFYAPTTVEFECAEVDDFVSVGPEKIAYFLLEFKTAMVGADTDSRKGRFYTLKV